MQSLAELSNKVENSSQGGPGNNGLSSLATVFKARVLLHEETEHLKDTPSPVNQQSSHDAMIVEEEDESGNQHEVKFVPTAKSRVFVAFTKHVPDTLLRDRMLKYHRSSDSYFVAAKTLATQLGIHCAMHQFLGRHSSQLADSFTVSPSGLLVTTGLLPKVVSPATHPEIDAIKLTQVINNNRTDRQTKHPVLRLTRNVTAPLTNAMILGGLVVSFGCSLDAIAFQRAVMEVLSHGSIPSN